MDERGDGIVWVRPAEEGLGPCDRASGWLDVLDDAAVFGNRNVYSPTYFTAYYYTFM